MHSLGGGWPFVAAVSALSLLVPAAAGAQDTFDPAGTPPREVRSGPTVHSSDGESGPLLSSVPRGDHLSVQRAATVGWRVAPGLRYSAWTRSEPQGPVRVHVLTAHLNRAGLRVDQVSGSRVASRHLLTDLLKTDRAVGGVNASFFDISDTQAPLGTGVDRQRSLLHAPSGAVRAHFVVDRKGRPSLGRPTFGGAIERRDGSRIRVGQFNLPLVPPGSVGMYTPAWGRAPGRRVVEGASAVRQVVVRNGVVRSKKRSLDRGTRIRGRLLIGVGAGADRLGRLRVGERVSVSTTLSDPDAKVVVSGSVALLNGGDVATKDNGELHPRTAIGYDSDRNIIHAVVVDGRSSSSKGQTLLQLARLMRSLGDEEAVNLDGGGSSTLAARNRNQRLRVLNDPSDGVQRPVPNGFAFYYRAPG